MYKVIICDDNEIMLSMISRILEPYAELYDIEIIGFDTGRDLLEYCRSNPFDIVYMDIFLTEEQEASDGTDYAKLLKVINPRALIIYITAYDGYYQKAVNAEPFRFVEKHMYDEECKNQFKEDMLSALNDAIVRLQGGEIWKYTYMRRQYSIEFAQIAGAYSFARKIHIISLRKIKQDFYYGNLNAICRELENVGMEFVRISKKAVVNVLYVQRLKDNKVKVGDKIFTVAPEYRERFNDSYLKYGRNMGDIFGDIGKI